jgi:hypothetical protein
MESEFHVKNENLEEILAKIQSLREDNKANGKLGIRLCEYTKPVASRILQALHQCSQKGTHFGTLLIDGFDGKERELERVRFEANILSLFTLMIWMALICLRMSLLHCLMHLN